MTLTSNRAAVDQPMQDVDKQPKNLLHRLVNRQPYFSSRSLGLIERCSTRDRSKRNLVIGAFLAEYLSTLAAKEVVRLQSEC